MGMFDYVDLGPHAPKCPLCGATLTGFQTKDSPPQLMVTYRVRPDGIVDRRPLDSGYDDEPRPEFKAVPADFCGVWTLAGACEKKCKATRSTIPGFGEMIYAESVYVQLVIMDGRLHRVKLLGGDDEA